MVQCILHGAMYIAWCNVYCMAQCILHGAMFITWCNVYCMVQCILHGAMYIAWRNVYCMVQCILHGTMYIAWCNVYCMTPDECLVSLVFLHRADSITGGCVHQAVIGKLSHHHYILLPGLCGLLVSRHLIPLQCDDGLTVAAVCGVLLKLLP